MILQINKVLERTDTLREDMIGDVKRTNTVDGFVMVELSNGDVLTLSKDSEDVSFDLDVSPEFKAYIVKDVWLLNDQGKTLRKLI